MYQIVTQQYEESDFNYEDPYECTLPEVYATLQSATNQLHILQDKARETHRARLEFQGYLELKYEDEWVPDYMTYYRIQEVELH